MSGHSKWSTIKHQKAANDQKRGQLFTKLARAITIAARDGGGDLETNFKLRLAIDKARQANMPKDNIQRAIDRGTGQGSEMRLFEVMYEGYGPGKAAVIVEAVTDNKNRTVAEIKKTFDRAGGSLGQAGAVSFQFDKKGQILLQVKSDKEEQMLNLIDLGAEDVEAIDEVIEVLVEPERLFEMRQKLEAAGEVIKQAGLIYLPKSLLQVSEDDRSKLMRMLEALEDLDDVQNVYCNAKL